VTEEQQGLSENVRRKHLLVMTFRYYINIHNGHLNISISLITYYFVTNDLRFFVCDSFFLITVETDVSRS